MFEMPWVKHVRMNQYLRGSLWLLPLAGGVSTYRRSSVRRDEGFGGCRRR
jgi:hypothetical protein